MARVRSSQTVSDYAPVAPRARHRAHGDDASVEATRDDQASELSRPQRRATVNSDALSTEVGSAFESLSGKKSAPYINRTTKRRHVKDGVAREEVGEVGEVGTQKRDAQSADRSKAGGEFKRLLLKRGHAATFFGLFLFTAILYFRPYEMFPALAAFKTMAYWSAIFTLVVFVPSQLAISGNLTARPPEVNLILLLCLAALLSMPLAASSAVSWETFSGTFVKVVIMFIVMVNVVRTERRWKMMIWLAVAVSVLMSGSAFMSYLRGDLTIEGYRAAGNIGGIFGNPNDMAVHLVTMLPLTIALFFVARNALVKIVCAVSAFVMLAGTLVTFSRGGFLGLAAAFLFAAWKLGKRNRFAVVFGSIISLALFAALAPGGYGARMFSIFDHSLDAVGSATARQQLLLQSIKYTITNPVFGVGMGNFPLVSDAALVSHNSYTQISAELGVAAFICYVLFIFIPFRRVGQIANETLAVREGRATKKPRRASTHELMNADESTSTNEALSLPAKRAELAAIRTREQRTNLYYWLALGTQASMVAFAVSSFFVSIAYLWNVYYLIGYAVCLRRLYESETGRPILSAKQQRASDKKRRANDVDVTKDDEAASDIETQISHGRSTRSDGISSDNDADFGAAWHAS